MKPLKGNKKIEDLFASGKRVSSSFLHCICLFNDYDGARFVVSVPKKNFSLAVKRNKIKRLLREVIRKNSSSFECFDSGWFMFVYSSDKTRSLSEINIDFHTLVKKIKGLSNKT